MPRKKRVPEQENHERWLISYADFITLLFAFFVVMFASSQADKGKAEQMSEAVKSALEGKYLPSNVASILGGAANDKGRGNNQMKGPGEPSVAQMKKQIEEAELAPSYEILTQELAQEIAAGQIQVSMQARGLVVSFAQAALFPSGNDEISESSRPGLQKVAAAMQKVPNSIRLEGHTDSRRIRTTRFKSNWELSAARSIALLEILSTDFGLPRSRMSIAGYADTAPLALNTTEEGRARNRRVDIVLLNEQAQLAEPKKDVSAGSDEEPVFQPVPAKAGKLKIYRSTAKRRASRFPPVE